MALFVFSGCLKLPERGVLPPHPRFRTVARNRAFFVNRGQSPRYSPYYEERAVPRHRPKAWVRR